MKLADRIALVRAGYTLAQIAEFEKAENNPTPAPAPADPTPAPAPADPTPAPAPADPTPAPATADETDKLREELRQLRETIAQKNIDKSRQPEKLTPEQSMIKFLEEE